MPDNWQSVDLKHLRALRAVAETGTFWAAAERLNASLSTVSDHITNLEALLGERLLERSRGRRTVTLTEAGRLLLGHAEAIESRMRAAEADFRAFAEGHTGSLRVGIYQSVANRVLPELLRRFHERWPNVDVEVIEATFDNDLVDMVEAGEVDLSFAIQPIPEGPFEVRELMSDPYVLVVAAGSPLARATRPRVADLAGRPMIGYRHGNVKDSAEEFLRGRGVSPRVVFRSTDNGTVQAMVASGLGFSLSPLLAVDESDPRVRLLELQESVPPRVLVVLWHRDRYRQPAAVAFVDTAVAVAREIRHTQAAFMAKASSRSRRRAPGRRPRLPASRPA